MTFDPTKKPNRYSDQHVLGCPLYGRVGVPGPCPTCDHPPRWFARIAQRQAKLAGKRFEKHLRAATRS